MSDFIGRVPVPAPTASGLVFPFSGNFPAGYAREWPVVEHRFGDLGTFAVQRFQVGIGPRKFSFVRDPLRYADRQTLLGFFDSVQGSYQTFLLDVPSQSSGATTRYEVIFENQPLAIAHTANAARVAINFLESPSSPTVPSYSVASTCVRYPNAPLASALTGQVQRIIPLIHIRVRNAAVPDIYLSDRRVNVGGQLYLPRLIHIGEPGSDVILSQTLSSEKNASSDNLRFSFGNADRVMSALVQDTALKFAQIELSLYHVDSQVLLQLWKGLVLNWTGDGSPEFGVSCSDGLYPTTQNYPRRTLSRYCWKTFNDGVHCPYQAVTGGAIGNPNSCDYGFDTPNGCLSHSTLSAGSTPGLIAVSGMAPYFGGHPAFPQSVVIKDNGTGVVFGFGRDTVTSTSILSDGVYDKALPEIWCNDFGNPQNAFWANALVVSVRDESTFEDLLGILGAGPLGAYEGMSVQMNADGFRFIVAPLADGFPPQGFKVNSQLVVTGYQPQLGLRQVLGADPSNPAFDFYALGQGSPQNWLIYDTALARYILAFAAGTAFCEVRYAKSPGSGISPTTAESHSLVVPIAKGLSGVKFDQFGSPTVVPGLVNPFWVAVNAFFRAIGLDGASAADQLAAIHLASLVAGDGTGAAEIADLSVPVIVGSGNETQFLFQGTISDFKPFRDWLTLILNCCLGYWNFQFGKLRLGIRANARAVAAFTVGNILYQSLSLSPIEAAFEYLKVDFANVALQCQSDMAEYQDKDHAAYFGRSGTPLTSRMRSPGISTLSQALRVAVTRVREEIGGILRTDQPNPYVEWDNAFLATFRTTILALDTDVGQVVSITHPDVPSYPGPVPGSPGAVGYVPQPPHTWNYRIVRWTLHKDWSVTIQARSVTDAMYDQEVGPKPQDVLPSAVPPIVYPLPSGPRWLPYQIQGSAASVLGALQWTFDVATTFALQSDGSPQAALSVTGKLPVTSYAPGVGAPLIGSITQSTTGGSLPGGVTIRLALCAIDANGQLGAPSSVAIVQIPSGTNTNQITLDGIVWPPAANLSGYALFGSTEDNQISCQMTGALAPSGNTYTPNSLPLTVGNLPPLSQYAVPDSQTDHVRVKGKQLWHAGIIGAEVTSAHASPDTITCADLIDGSGSPINLTGRTLSVIGRQNGASIPFFSLSVTGWDPATGTFTVATDPTAVVQAGDVIVVRYAGYDTTADQLHFRDAGIQNQTNGYAGMIPGQEIGRVARVIFGLNAGELRKVTANTVDTFTWDAPLLLDATSVLVIEDPAWLFKADFSDAPNAIPATVASVSVPISNYTDFQLLLAGFTVDLDDVESPDGDVPIREVWSYGVLSEITVTANGTVGLNTGMETVDTSGGNIARTLQAAAAAPNQLLVLRKKAIGDGNSVSYSVAGGSGNSFLGGATSIVLNDVTPSVILKYPGRNGSVITPLGAGSSGAAGAALLPIEKDASVAPITIVPPGVATPGQTVKYYILQGHAVTWGSITGAAFKQPPPIPTDPGLTSTVTFSGRADGNWWYETSLLGVNP